MVLLPPQKVLKHLAQPRRLGPHNGDAPDPLKLNDCERCGMGKALAGLALEHGVGRTTRQAEEWKTLSTLET